MADPYMPPKGGPYTQDRNPRDPASVDPQRPIPVSTDRSGFGTGMLVAMVFVVVAILAALLYRPWDTGVQQPAPAAETAPVAPAAPAPDAPAAAGGAATDDATGDATVTPDAAPAEPVTPPAEPVTPPATNP